MCKLFWSVHAGSEVSVTRNSKRTVTHTAQGRGRECVEQSLREDSKNLILVQMCLSLTDGLRWAVAWEGMLKDVRFSDPQ